MFTPNKTTISKFHKSVSYIVLLMGFVTLLITGSLGLVSLPIFLFFIICAWYFESSTYQISETVALMLIVATIPICYICWKVLVFEDNHELPAVTALAYIIVTIGIVKLFQIKTERDWIFLYLISFFEILLASGTSISPFFFLFLILYLLFAVSSIITFEMWKASRLVVEKNCEACNLPKLSFFRLPIISLSLLCLIISFAIPTFFFLPRTGNAGTTTTSKSLSGTVGFSSSVELGRVGLLQPNFQTIMRVEIENEDNIPFNSRKLRGIALDEFTNKIWKKSNFAGRQLIKNAEDVFIIKDNQVSSKLSLQKIVLETIDTPVLFSISNPISITGDIDTILLDSDESISGVSDSDRLVYSVNSDISLPNLEDLIGDNTSYSTEYSRYLQIPNLDSRISNLSEQIVKSQNAKSSYEKAIAIENYLKNSYTYTLDLKATGEEPLADFLFDKKAGHCEYFATALAIMLRTQGVAARVVNGFQFGEYNESANLYIVKQKDAHSWVEVYFPATDKWIPFDATPFSGLTNGQNDNTFAGRLSGYIEALETFWIQYFVSFDNKNQQSIFKSAKLKFFSYQNTFSVWMSETQQYIMSWWNDLRGEKGFEAKLYAIIYGIGFIVLILLICSLSFFFGRRIWRSNLWNKVVNWFRKKQNNQIIEFYERMNKALEKQGFTRAKHQTPMEFATDLNISEALKITEDYQRVRFGDHKLSDYEMVKIESWLRKIETEKK
jgi:protein-glutamine gamma-glutamyltransferase